MNIACRSLRALLDLTGQLDTVGKQSAETHLPRKISWILLNIRISLIKIDRIPPKVDWNFIWMQQDTAFSLRRVGQPDLLADNCILLLWLGCFDLFFLWENAISERVVLRSKWESVSLEIFLHIYRGFCVAVVQITNYFSSRLHLDALQLCLWNCTNQCISTAEIHSDELVGFQSNFRHYFAALQACSFAYICRIIKLFGKRCKKASMPLDDRSIRVRKEPR